MICRILREEMGTGLEEATQSPFIDPEWELHICIWLPQVLVLFSRHGVFVCLTWNPVAETEFGARQLCLDISNVTTSVAVTKFKLEPTEIHWTSPFLYVFYPIYCGMSAPGLFCYCLRNFLTFLGKQPTSLKSHLIRTCLFNDEALTYKTTRDCK